jgi:hypothetical protein
MGGAEVHTLNVDGLVQTISGGRRTSARVAVGEWEVQRDDRVDAETGEQYARSTLRFLLGRCQRSRATHAVISPGLGRYLDED